MEKPKAKILQIKDFIFMVQITVEFWEVSAVKRPTNNPPKPMDLNFVVFTCDKM